jgi:hypothetical protein
VYPSHQPNNLEFLIRASPQTNSNNEQHFIQRRELTTRGQRKTNSMASAPSAPTSSRTVPSPLPNQRRPETNINNVLAAPLNPYARMFPQGQRSMYNFTKQQQPRTSPTPHQHAQQQQNPFPRDKNLRDILRPQETFGPTISSFARIYAGGHQQDYIRAKLAHFHTREMQQQQKLSNQTKHFPNVTATTTTLRWQMDKNANNIMESQRIQDALPPPLRTFGKMYTAMPITPHSQTYAESFHQHQQQQQYTTTSDFTKTRHHLDLPTGAAQVKAIAKGGPSTTASSTHIRATNKGMVKF